MSEEMVPSMVLKTASPIEAHNVVSIKSQPQPVDPSVLKIAHLFGIQRIDSLSTSMQESMERISKFLMKDSDEVEKILEKLDTLESDLPVTIDMNSRIRQLDEFVKAVTIRDEIDHKIKKMKVDRIDPEELGVETGNWVPFLREVQRKNVVSSSSS